MQIQNAMAHKVYKIIIMFDRNIYMSGIKKTQLNLREKKTESRMFII